MRVPIIVITVVLTWCSVMGHPKSKRPAPEKKATARKGKSIRVHHRDGTFGGKVARNGNSTSLRLESSFFATQTLFSIGADIEATAIGDGTVLVRAVKRAKQENEVDPVAAAFLDFVERDMVDHPESIKPIEQAELDEIAALVEGVVID